jgi:hypothetical protein
MHSCGDTDGTSAAVIGLRRSLIEDVPLRHLNSCALALLALSGCARNSANPDPAIEVTPSTSGTVVARQGATSTLAVTFTSPSTEKAYDLVVAVANLPANWSGPASFGCAELDTGHPCVLTLAYSPAAAARGAITLTYQYTYGRFRRHGNGTLSLPYEATSNNNINASAAPGGPTYARIGTGSRNVEVTFTTDDGLPASALTLRSGADTLPPGWSGLSAGFDCAVVSTGNGCQFLLQYAPSVVDSGVFTLEYEYLDNSGTAKTGNVNVVYAATSSNNVVGIASPSGQVNAVVATGTQSVHLNFTTDDGNTASEFEVTSNLAALPAAWSTPADSFTCDSVSIGNGCQLTLSYVPVTVGGGTLTIAYAYVDNSGASKTGSVDVAYASTSNNNLIASAAPLGQINAVVGTGTQPVVVTFTTDDGNAASALALTTDLSALPPGWSSSANTLSCVSVSTGNGCQLSLSYAPSSVGSAILSLSYTYVANSGTVKTGAISLPYTSTSDNNVVASSAPSGQINAVVGAGTQPVVVTFTTDDGNASSALALTTDLTTLPAGWSSSASTFSCASVSTGNGCQLSLSYAPTAVGSGTLALSYAYVGNSGTARTGTVNLSYASTSNNNVAASSAPSGQINAVVGGGTQPVAVTFTTDDGNIASALAVTSDLTSLPAGWSSLASTFSCASVSTGSGCQLALSYTPSAVGSGNVILQFGYVDNSGTTKTGSITIPFASTANNNVAGTVTPGGQINAVAGTGTQSVAIVFATDDGNSASALAISTDLSALPAGWSHSTGSFSCVNVTGTSCQLTLQYAPSVAASGTLSLGFGYTNNAGIAKTGTVAIDYVATAPVVRAYVAQLVSNLLACPLAADGTLASCAATGSGFSAPTGITFVGNHAYVSDYYANLVWKCDVDAQGALSACVSTGDTFLYPMQIDSKDGWLYVANAINFGGVTSCAIGIDGTLSNCTRTAGSGLIALEIDGDFLYTGSGNNLQVCSVAAPGPPTGCAGTGSGFNAIWGVGLDSGFAYIGNQGSGNVTVCSRNPTNGTLSACSNYAVGGGPTDVLIRGSQAYVADLYGNLRMCEIGSGNGLFNCASVTGGTSLSFVLQIAIR